MYNFHFENALFTFVARFCLWQSYLPLPLPPPAGDIPARALLLRFAAILCRWIRTEAGHEAVADEAEPGQADRQHRDGGLHQRRVVDQRLVDFGPRVFRRQRRRDALLLAVHAGAPALRRFLPPAAHQSIAQAPTNRYPAEQRHKWIFSARQMTIERADEANALRMENSYSLFWHVFAHNAVLAIIGPRHRFRFFPAATARKTGATLLCIAAVAAAVVRHGVLVLHLVCFTAAQEFRQAERTLAAPALGRVSGRVRHRLGTSHRPLLHRRRLAHRLLFGIPLAPVEALPARRVRRLRLVQDARHGRFPLVGRFFRAPLAARCVPQPATRQT